MPIGRPLAALSTMIAGMAGCPFLVTAVQPARDAIAWTGFEPLYVQLTLGGVLFCAFLWWGSKLDPHPGQGI